MSPPVAGRTLADSPSDASHRIREHLRELPYDIARSLTETQLASLAASLAAFPSLAASRGTDYALADRVYDVERDGDDVRARVRGTRTWAVRWRLDADHPVPVCSCPVGPLCKHAFAVGLRLVGAAVIDGTELPSSLVTILPRAWRGDARPPLPRSLERRTPAPGERVDPRVRALRDSATTWQRLGAAEALLWRAGFTHDAIAALDLEEVLHEPDPDLRCWRLARAAAASPGGRVPRPLQPWLERPDLESRATESTRRHVVERLADWARADASRTRQLRVVLGLERDPVTAGVSVTVQVRLSGGRHTDEPRTSSQLLQLMGELRRDPRVLSPPQARLLRMLVAHEMQGVFARGTAPQPLDNEQLNLLLDRAAGSPFVAWSETLPRDLAARAGVEPGARARLDGEDLRVVLDCRAEGEDLRLGLALADAAGHVRPFDAAMRWSPAPGLSTTHPTVVLQDGAFHRVSEEPPADIVRMIAELHGVPLRREDAPLLDRLAARFSGVADVVRSLTRTHAARPVISLDLRPSDWLHVRVFAHAGETPWRPGLPQPADAILFEHTPQDGWVRLAGDAPTPGENLSLAPAGAADVPADDGEAPAGDPGAAPDAPEASPWREVPDPARVAGALEWLEAIGAVRGDRRGPGGAPPEPDAATGWWLRLTARTAEKLDAHWRTRPLSVAWFGNRAARDLFADVRRVRTRMSVVASGIDWLSVRAEWESEGLTLTEEDLAALRNARAPFVRLSGGWVRRDMAEDHDAVAAALADLGLEADGREQRLPLWQLAQARAESFETLARAGADGETLAALARIRESLAAFEGVPRVAVPAGLTATLRPYQREGLDFLAWTSSLGLGAVLADDMGLGKTVQALAWLAWLHEREPSGGPSLVVCPASVAHNWARESARFTPHLRVLVLGSGRERLTQLREVEHYDLVVTNYALLRRDIAHWREIPLRAAILDEAQNIKNPDAAAARAARDLPARHRIALTGTPLENRALDLWSILAFACPGLLGPRARFVERYDRADAPPYARRLLSARLRPVLLRRLKEQVERDLPTRIEERLDCEMTPSQRKLYLAELVNARREIGTALAGEDAGLGRQRVVVLAVLTRLRQICCHPALVTGDMGAGSGKLEALFELLEPLLAEGQKVLVFSQFVRALELIETRLAEARIPYHVLTGETPTREREAVVTEFTERPDPCVFLVSLKAGGTGLNLTAASHVVLFDPWWNPAVEAQAIDRTHRIGQTKAVVAYRLYTEGTVEERIAELQARKARLAKDVLGEDAFARALTRDDLAYLLAE